jgi:putative ABC transport system permease protein
MLSFWRSARSDVGLWLMTAVLGVAVGATAIACYLLVVVAVRPLPVSGTDRIVLLHGLGVAMQDPVTWWGQAPALESVALYRTGDALFGGPGGERWVRTTHATPRFFNVFSIRPQVGRAFVESDGQAGVAVVSHRFWRAHLNRRPIESTDAITLNGLAFTVIGIAPDGFTFPSETDVWIPLPRSGDARFNPTESGAQDLVRIPTSFGWVGRMKPGFERKQLRSQLLVLLGRAEAELAPRTGVRFGDGVGITLLEAWMSRDVRPTFVLVALGSGCVLAIAVVNAGFFLLTRMTRRRREFAIRATVGASPARLVGQLGAEALVMGAMAGLPAVVSVGAGVRLADQPLRQYGLRVPDAMTGLLVLLIATLAAAMAVMLMAMVTSAAHLKPLALANDLRAGAGSSGHLRASWFRRLFVVAEIALTLVLLSGAASLTKSLLAQLIGDRGFQTSGIVTARIMARTNPAAELPPSTTRAQELIETVARMPGARHVAVVQPLPVVANDAGYDYVSDGTLGTGSRVTSTAGDFFSTAGLAFVSGQMDPRPDAVVINEALATVLWGSASPLGRLVWVGGEESALRVTGVVRNVRLAGQGPVAVPDLYRSFPALRTNSGLSPPLVLDVLVRCQEKCGTLTRALATTLVPRSDILVARIQNVDDLVAAALGSVRLRAGVWSAYTVLGLAVTLIGVLSFSWFVQSRRRQEMVTRSALGASRAAVLCLLAREGLVCTVLGVALGVLLTLAVVDKVLQALVVDLVPRDASVMAIAALGIAVVGTLAGLVPALAGSKVVPEDFRQQE